MYVTKADYRNFRCIGNAAIELSPEVNILCGGNAEGKTSALEGIYLCSTGRSHRTAHESELIRSGCQFGMMGIEFRDALRERSAEMYFFRSGKKSCLLSGMSVKKMSEFVGAFKAIIFCPEHLSIIKEGPSERRNFLDQAIVKNDREYLIALQGYSSALSQRNSILSELSIGKTSFSDMLPMWSEKLCEYAEIISIKRGEYIAELEEQVKIILGDMTFGKDVPSFTYLGGYNKDELMKKLDNNREREVRMGSTLFGIHKDDIGIMLSSMPARSYGSQGQQRSLALAMKLSEGEICKNKFGEYPVYLLDDILSELDTARKEYIVRGFSSPGEKKQIIITSCDEKDFRDKRMPGNSRMICVKGGCYYPE